MVKIGQFWPLTMDKIEGVMVMVSAVPPPPQLGDHDFLTIWPTSGGHGNGQKIVDQDHGKKFQNFLWSNGHKFWPWPWPKSKYGGGVRRPYFFDHLI